MSVYDSNLIATPKGMFDLHCEDVKIREYIINEVKEVFKIYDAIPIDTPIIERKTTITNLYGEEFNKLVYELQDQGDNLILRYDLTVPFARYVANNGLIQFKRYQIGKVYRRDQPNLSKGRYREFLQADFDIIGPKSIYQEVEILSLLHDIFNKFIKDKYIIKISDRSILNNIIKSCGIVDNINSVCSTIDKLDKCSYDDIFQELSLKTDNDKAVKLLTIIQCQNNLSPYEMISKLKLDGYIDDDKYHELTLLLDMLSSLNILSVITFDLSLARGLDYYNGLIYEVVMKDNNILTSSIAAGGRYDNLLGKLSNKGSKESINAIGCSIGIERLVTVLQKLDFIYDNLGNTDVFVASVGKNMAKERLKLTLELRQQGIKAQTIYQDSPNMRLQFKHVFDKNIPYMIIVGDNEITNNVVKFKNILISDEITVPRNNIITFLKSKL